MTTTYLYTLEQFHRLRDAEQYFEFFDLPYEPKVVSVNRLHILRKFSTLMEEVEAKTIDEGETLEGLRSALSQAYSTFLTSSSVDEKLFKVFQDRPKNVVMMSDITVE